VGDVVGVLYGLDRTIFLLINRSLQNPVFDQVMPALSNKWLGFVVVGVVVPCLFLRYGRRVWPVIALAVLAVALSDLGAGLLKHAVQRVRPCHVIPDVHLLAGCTRSFAMPSNHASNMFALAGVVGSLLPALRWVLLPVAGGVAYSRVYLGVHYPSDVLIGALCGTAIGWGLALAVRRIAPAKWALGATPGRNAPLDAPGGKEAL
jgi:undecaprenyl-diphosphatase